VPYRSFYKQADNSAGLTTPYFSTEYMVESTLVFDFKVASAGVFVNHYSDGVSRWNFGLNIGFLLFNNKYLD
jgi:NTE family protein